MRIIWRKAYLLNNFMMNHFKLISIIEISFLGDLRIFFDLLRSQTLQKVLVYDPPNGIRKLHLRFIPKEPKNLG